MAWRVKKVGEVFTVPTPSSSPPAAGSFVEKDGTVAPSLASVCRGFVIDDVPDDNPPKVRDCYGDGSILEDTDATFTIDQEIYSDGDGTISQTQGAGAAGTIIVVVGKALSATEFLVNITPIEKGA